MTLNEWLQLYTAWFLSTAVVTVLFGCDAAGAMWNCCHIRKFCVHHTAMHQFRVRCTLFSCNFHLHFWQNDWDLLHATAVIQRWNGYRKWESVQKADPGEENSPATPARTRTQDLSIMSLLFYHRAIPALHMDVVIITTFFLLQLGQLFTMPKGRAHKRYTAGPTLSRSHTTQTLFFTYRVHNFRSIWVDDFCTFNAATIITITINITAMAETCEEEGGVTQRSERGDPQVRGMTHRSEGGDPHVRK